MTFGGLAIIIGTAWAVYLMRTNASPQTPVRRYRERENARQVW